MVLYIAFIESEISVVIYSQGLRHPNQARHVQWREYIRVFNCPGERYGGSSVAVFFVIRCGASPASAEEATSSLNYDGYARGSSGTRGGSRDSHRTMPLSLKAMLEEKIVDCRPIT